jgi:membrane carboxypeptidase/penicillin-binding protein
VVWIGYDDNAEFEMEAAKSALPVWTGFMKRAHTLRQYAGTKPFDAPKGVVRVNIDPMSGLLPGPFCPSRPEYFIAGTQPKVTCEHDQFDTYDENGLPVARTEPTERKPNIFKSVLGIFR